MDIKVDTDLHQYAGEMDVLYENNSPDELKKVFMYAFFNAFQPGSMMDVRSRNISDPDSRVGSRISELPEEEWGWIKDVILTMDGEPCIVTIEETILVVDLPTPIVSGTNANFQMSWKAQVPRQIRRSGWMNKEGIELTIKSFESTLDKFGMVPIYPNNEEFDPEKHEAVSMEQNKDKEDGYVGNILQRGWELHSRVLRPARVTVIKN